MYTRECENVNCRVLTYDDKRHTDDHRCPACAREGFIVEEDDSAS